MYSLSSRKPPITLALLAIPHYHHVTKSMLAFKNNNMSAFLWDNDRFDAALNNLSEGVEVDGIDKI